MDEKNNKFTKIDKLVQKNYSFVGAIGTYLNIEPGDISHTEAEINIMKKKEEDKFKKTRN
ncbi:MAG: hypothetical protein GX053_10285 [Tissierella sp.]|nr:hypothetical protein [Tissierella sp.]